MSHDQEFVWPDQYRYPTFTTPGAFDELLKWAEANAVSDVTVQTREPIMCERHGRHHAVTSRLIEPAELQQMLAILYGAANGPGEVMAGHDLDFAHEVQIDRKKRIRFRVNATAIETEGGLAGIQITLRILDSTPRKVETMGIEKEILDNFAPRQGVVMITGPTGSGKTTLLGACIRMIAEDPNAHKKIITIEAPVEIKYTGFPHPTCSIAQSEVPRHLKSFAHGVRNALRRKPFGILVGEARDLETISAVSEAALTGHCVWTTAHTNGVAETIQRLTAAFPSGENKSRSVDLIEGLRMIVTQALLPSTDGKRVACREFLLFEEDMRSRLLSVPVETWPIEVRKFLRERGQTMAQAVRKVHDKGLVEDAVARRYYAREEMAG